MLLLFLFFVGEFLVGRGVVVLFLYFLGGCGVFFFVFVLVVVWLVFFLFFVFLVFLVVFCCAVFWCVDFFFWVCWVGGCS